MVGRDKDSAKGLAWSDSVVVAQIPETGLHRELEASAAQREALAQAAGLNMAAGVRRGMRFGGRGVRHCGMSSTQKKRHFA